MKVPLRLSRVLVAGCFIASPAWAGWAAAAQEASTAFTNPAGIAPVSAPAVVVFKVP